MYDRVNKYFITNFIDSFISLFLTLFLIVSIVFFINIARITSYVEINFLELGKLYSFLLPQIILFTVPISFFVSLTISIFKLSKENESIVIFTLGQSPKKIAGCFLLISGGLSVILLLNALVLMPYMKYLNTKFVDFKRTQFTLNIRPGEFGQKFGQWFIFAGSKDSATNTYKDIVLYNPNNNDERLIISSGGHTLNEDGAFSLVLDSGNFYDISSDKWNYGDYKSMKITSLADKINLDEFSLRAYWSQMKDDAYLVRDFTIFTLIALFPFASALFAFSFGLVVYRYERIGPYIGMFAVLLGYFSAIMLFSKNPIFGIPLVFALCFALSVFFFKLKVLKKF